MAGPGWEIIDKLTGELISPPGRWISRYSGDRSEVSGVQRLNKSGIEFGSDNLYFDKTKVDLSSKKKFSKVFHIERVEYSHTIYYAYWHLLSTRVSYNNNIVYHYTDGCIKYARTKSDLMKICQSSRSTFYKFYKESYQKNYIKTFGDTKKDRLYIINPRYVLNGTEMAKDLYSLFNESRQSDGNELG